MAPQQGVSAHTIFCLLLCAFFPSFSSSLPLSLPLSSPLFPFIRLHTHREKVVEEEFAAKRTEAVAFIYKETKRIVADGWGRKAFGELAVNDDPLYADHSGSINCSDSIVYLT